MRFSKTLIFILFLTLCHASYGNSDGITDQTMRDYYAAWAVGDVDRIMSYFTADIVYSDKATGAHNEGADEVRAFVKKFFDDYAGVSIATASITVSPNNAAVEWVMSGGEGDDAWSIPGVCIFDIKDGKLSRATDYWNKE